MPSTEIGKRDLNEEISRTKTSEEVLSDFQICIVEFLGNYEEIGSEESNEIKEMLTTSIRNKIESIFGE